MIINFQVYNWNTWPTRFQITDKHTVKSRFVITKNMIKYLIRFVHICIWDFLHFECIPLCISRISFSSVENTIIFLATFCWVCWFWIYVLSRILKLNVFESSQVDNSYFNGLNQSHSIWSCIVSVSLVITNQDLYGLQERISKWNEPFL